MLSRKMNWLAVLIAVLPLALGCSSDDTTGTGGGGGGGGGGPTLSGGIYDMTFDSVNCPVPASPMGTTTGGPLTFELVVCNSQTLVDVIELPCPVQGSGNVLSIDCQFTDVDGGCTTTYRIQGTATKNGNDWVIEGTQEIISENPPGCSGEPDCSEVMITITQRVAGAPTACAYADGQTVEANITGGPLAGAKEYAASGFVTTGTFGWQWNLNAGFDSSNPIATQSSNALNSSFMNFNIPELDDQSLPQSYPITMSFGASKAAGEPVFMGYGEQHTSGSSFFGESVTSGTMFVEEVSADHIAGTYTVDISGQTLTPPSTFTPGTRQIQGGFHVREGLFDFAVSEVEDLPVWRGWRDHMKSR